MIDMGRGLVTLLRPGGLLRNVVCNGWGLGFQIGTGLITVPLLVHGLGATSYGTWILIGSLTDYFGLLDFGIRGAVGRYVAMYDALAERTELASLLSTALAVLGGVGLIGLVGIAALSRRATSTSTRSPAAWPWWSLTRLK